MRRQGASPAAIQAYVDKTMRATASAGYRSPCDYGLFDAGSGAVQTAFTVPGLIANTARPLVSSGYALASGEGFEGVKRDWGADQDRFESVMRKPYPTSPGELARNYNAVVSNPVPSAITAVGGLYDTVKRAPQMLSEALTGKSPLPWNMDPNLAKAYAKWPGRR